MKREEKRVKKLVPYGLWDFTGLQTWLNQQARAGYALEKWPGFWFIGQVIFREDPSAVCARYCLDPIQKHFGEAQLAEQAARYRELGWNYVGKIWNYYAIYRCDDPQAPELYTDPDSLAWAMKKQVRLALLRPLFWLLWLAVLSGEDWSRLLYERAAVVMNLILRSDVVIPSSLALFALFFLCLFYWIGALWGVRRIRASLRRGKQPAAQLRCYPVPLVNLIACSIFGIFVLYLAYLGLTGAQESKTLSGPEDWDFPHVTLEEILPAGAVFRPYNHQEMLSPNTFDHSLLAPQQYDVAQGGTVQVDGGPQQDTRLYQEWVQTRSPSLAQAVYQGQVAARRRSLELYRLNWEKNASTLHPDLPNAYDQFQEEALSYPGLDGLTRFTYQYSNETTPNIVYIGWVDNRVFVLNCSGAVDSETALDLLTQRLAED